ncbi:hypothetical protein [Enterobacter hormaechei]|uniref:hypothetical protein n=1 Tax=Enterobacter hormaechei TaxID=158836 RepID=UPI0020406F65|nr:hypothetical protein [Enterobacter hormaechei]
MAVSAELLAQGFRRQLAAQYPDGVPETALDEVMVTLTTPARNSVISIVNGN